MTRATTTLASALCLLLPLALSPAARAADVATIVFEVDDQLKFPVSKFEVKSGQTVKLTIKKGGSMPKASMAHNVVILKPGVNVDQFAIQAMTFAATDYIPTGSEAQIVAHTKMVGAGESDTIEFKAPAPGTYRFLCTFPGHFATMQGDMIVK
jgi:azurin